MVSVGAGAVGGAGTSGGTELPDIETQQGLQQLAQKDARIDEQLEQVAEGVNELREIALTMRDEVKVQAGMIDEITNKARRQRATPPTTRTPPSHRPPAMAGGLCEHAPQLHQQEDEEDARVDSFRGPLHPRLRAARHPSSHHRVHHFDGHLTRRAEPCL